MKKILLVVCMVLSLSGCVGSTNKVTLRQKDFESSVKKELDLKASNYFDGVKKDEVISINGEQVNIKKVGKYDAQIKFRDKGYDVTFNIVDREKPTLKVNKKLFVFDLTTRLTKVNEAINKDIVITDNYDTTFDQLTVIKALPTSEKEIICKLKVSDTSKNVSDEIEIKVQFTKNGKEKQNLKQEQVAIESSKSSNDKVASTSPKKDAGTNKPSKPNNSGGNQGSSPKPKPNPKPEPKPEPTPEPEPTKDLRTMIKAMKFKNQRTGAVYTGTQALNGQMEWGWFISDGGKNNCTGLIVISNPYQVEPLSDMLHFNTIPQAIRLMDGETWDLNTAITVIPRLSPVVITLNDLDDLVLLW